MLPNPLHNNATRRSRGIVLFEDLVCPFAEEISRVAALRHLFFAALKKIVQPFSGEVFKLFAVPHRVFEAAFCSQVSCRAVRFNH